MTILSIIYTPRDESTCNTVAKYVWGFLKLETREPGLIKNRKGGRAKWKLFANVSWHPS